MTHGHEVLEMMFGNSYASSEELVKAIIDKFGADERFYTCHAENLTAKELVEFFEARGKFMPTSTNGFTADPNKKCKHDQ